MPKHKKKWIVKGNDVEKFRLVPRDLINEDSEISKEKCAEEAPNEKDIEEHIKYGIYFNDDYDYMQHLRSRNEVGRLEKDDCFIVSAPNAKINESCTLLEKEGFEVNVKSPKNNEHQDLTPCLDAEIVAALEGNFDFEDPNNLLEDDFIILANDGELPSKKPPNRRNEDMYSMRYRESDFDLEEMDDLLSQDSEDDNYEVDANVNKPEMCVRQHSNVPLASDRLLEENFAKICDEYEQDGMDYEDQESEEGLEPNSDRLKVLAAEYKSAGKDIEDLVCDDEIRRFALAAGTREDSPIRRVNMEIEDSKKPEWDCESILSTYSNIYNHPKLIAEPSRKRKLKSVLKDIEMDDATSVLSTRTVSTVRPPGETTEERKIRKAAIREVRAERRIQKKNTKLAFKKAKNKLTSELTNNNVKFRRIS